MYCNPSPPPGMKITPFSLEDGYIYFTLILSPWMPDFSGSRLGAKLHSLFHLRLSPTQLQQDSYFKLLSITGAETQYHTPRVN